MEKLLAEMKSLKERYIGSEEDGVSAMADPSTIPMDMQSLSDTENGRDTAATDVPKDGESKDEPKDEPQDTDIENVLEMSSEEVKESLDMCLDIAYECIQKAKGMIDEISGNKEAKADLKEVVDEKMVERGDDVLEAFTEFVDLLEDIEADEDTTDDEPKDEPKEEPKDKEPKDKEPKGTDTDDDDEPVEPADEA